MPGTEPAPVTQKVAVKTKSRNPAAKQVLGDLFLVETSAPDTVLPLLAANAGAVLLTVIGTLADDPPASSQAAEAALTILAITLVEGRQLDIVTHGSIDVGRSGRLDGDRSLGDWLCLDLLTPRNIPSTKGPFQSSSYRAGYMSDQVRDSGLRNFVTWYSQEDRDFDELSAFARHLVRAFQKTAVELPLLPEIMASRLTFLNFGRFREKLLSAGSGGAFEQYLVAGLLEQELVASGTRFRVQTKNVGANDAAAHAGGDVEVRDGQTLLKAYEVTANSWNTKLAQLDSSAKAGLTEVTVVANGVANLPASAVSEALATEAERLGVDVSVIDLNGLIDVLASRITKHARAEAIVSMYRYLARWHRRQPELVVRLVDTLFQLELVLDDHFATKNPLPESPAERILAQISSALPKLGAVDEMYLPGVLRDLADRLEIESAP